MQDGKPGEKAADGICDNRILTERENSMGYQETRDDETASGGNWWIMWLFLAVVAGAAMFLVPNYLRARVSGQFTACQSNCKNIGTALEIYADANGKNYPRSLTMLTPDYLLTIPTCPSSRTNRGYIDSYLVNDDFKAYTVYCQGRNHMEVARYENYPQYNSREGIVGTR